MKPHKSAGWRWDKKQMKKALDAHQDRAAAPAPKMECTCGPNMACSACPPKDA